MRQHYVSLSIGSAAQNPFSLGIAAGMISLGDIAAVSHLLLFSLPGGLSWMTTSDLSNPAVSEFRVGPDHHVPACLLPDRRFLACPPTASGGALWILPYLDADTQRGRCSCGCTSICTPCFTGSVCRRPLESSEVKWGLAMESRRRVCRFRLTIDPFEPGYSRERLWLRGWASGPLQPGLENVRFFR